MLDKYKVILWDFDGVIMDSMPVRDLGFVKVLENDYPKHEVDELLKYHKANGGLSRYVKFRYFFEDIRKEAVSEVQISALSAAFSKIMLSLLVDSRLLISDSLEFIKTQYKNYTFHIVSGSDGEELNTICKALLLDQYFASIHGSPTPKKVLVKELIYNFGYDRQDVCLIGDSHNDADAAELNGISFFGYNNLALSENKSYLYNLSTPLK